MCSSEEPRSDILDNGDTDEFWVFAARFEGPPALLYGFRLVSGTGTLLAATSGPVGSINPGVTPLLEFLSIAPG